MNFGTGHNNQMNLNQMNLSPQHTERFCLDILTPVYNEEAGLRAYHLALQEFMKNCSTYNVRVIFIEDGSVDRSWKVIQEICSQDARFEGIRLSRNYGSHTALCAGFSQSSADAVATLACDLQDPPEVVQQFLEKWRAGAQIVWGKRRSRDDGVWRPIASKIFEIALRKFAMPTRSKFTTGSFFLVDRRVAESFKQFKEHHRTTFALVAWTGFEQDVVEYDRKPRLAGVSGWSFTRMMRTMYDTFLGFSFLPVRMITLTGLAVSFFSLCLGLYLLWNWITGHPMLGWSSLALLLTFFFGVQFLIMGCVGEYLYRIYAEVLNRPLYFVSDRTTEKLSAENTQKEGPRFCRAGNDISSQ